MKRVNVVLLVLIALGVVLTPATWAKGGWPPLIFGVWPNGSELVIVGLNLAVDQVTEPSVTLNDQVLVVTSFTTTEVRALLPDPPLGAGSYLLTVESKQNKVGVFDATLAVADLICTGCVSEAELDFDPATQGELTDHVALPNVHHTPPTELPPSGAAGGDLTGSYPNPTLGNNAVTAAKVDTTEVQLRVSGTCPPGASIREVSATGGVTCEASTDTTLSPKITGPWTVVRSNERGQSFKWLGWHDGRRVCFLTKVEVEETDTGGESAGCQVYKETWHPTGLLSWFLHAYLGKSSDADVRCEAMCLSW